MGADNISFFHDGPPYFQVHDGKCLHVIRERVKRHDANQVCSEVGGEDAYMPLYLDLFSPVGTTKKLPSPHKGMWIDNPNRFESICLVLNTTGKMLMNN